MGALGLVAVASFSSPSVSRPRGGVVSRPGSSRGVSGSVGHSRREVAHEPVEILSLPPAQCGHRGRRSATRKTTAKKKTVLKKR